MSDCPNCGTQVDDAATLCPNCGFDLHSQSADAVRRLHEEGKIHPGRLGASDPDDFAGGDASETPAQHSDLPAEDREHAGPEELDAGL
jgi:RNA polymerase subunit RPABC4/transcription elongation factor Spt4